MSVETEDRSKFIGASEVPEALGLSPYQGASPVRLAQEKLGLIERKQIDPKLSEWGHRLQPTILRAVEDRIGVRVRESDEPKFHKTENWLRARTDGVTADGRIVEVKNYAEGRAAKYPDENSPEELPLYDLVQVAVEMACHDVEVAHFGVLFGGRDFRCYRIERDPDFEQEILNRLGKFWSFVQKKKLTAPRSAADTLLIYPRHTEGLTRAATPELIADAHRLAELKKIMKGLDDEVDLLQNRLKKHMGAAGLLTTHEGTLIATWKADTDSEVFDTKKFRAEHPEIAERYLKLKAGARKFLLKI